jgi:uncharacterized protein (TIGR03435 family)
MTIKVSNLLMKLVVVGLTLVLVSAQAAQTPLSFEAASVKVNKSGDWRKSLGPAPGGRFLVVNNTLRDVIPYAFGLPQATASFRIVGGPSWMDEDRFDITAKVDGSWTPQQMSEMLRTLLAERFKLVAHNETRELPTYSLVRTSPSLGARLRPSEVDQAACDARRAAIQRREPVPPIPAGAKPICGTGRTVPGTITAVGWSMNALASALSPFVTRVVFDRTELTGLYDFTVTWTPDEVPQLPPDAPPLSIDPNGPTLFTALQEQLGLRLVSARAPVDVLVIDRAQRPAED